MKIQLDSEKKTIKIEGNVKLSDLVKHLESLLPKDCKLGYWKDYELECNVVITHWSNPIIIRDYVNPWWVNPYNSGTTLQGQAMNIKTTTDINGWKYSSNPQSSFNHSTVSSNIYNLKLN